LLRVAGITNPLSLAPSAQFTYQGKTSTNVLVCSGSIPALQNDFPAPFTVTSHNFNSRIMATATTLTVSLSGNRIPSGGYLVITIPSEFTIGSIACSNPVGFTLSTYTPTPSSSQLKVTSTG
jgi:hypothetical protein